ncbi:hypothetical protein EYF80_049757 [Liparis tanakae]|uniref:Uncharacterized protein n=1 Tax=Liparis tanakae TaxID=230148 RepID=A0A4Z2FGQ7_9TELE|nr:hypothetical protein EYF80_049757 [Liparis tanakae]
MHDLKERPSPVCSSGITIQVSDTTFARSWFNRRCYVEALTLFVTHYPPLCELEQSFWNAFHQSRSLTAGGYEKGNKTGSGSTTLN